MNAQKEGQEPIPEASPSKESAAADVTANTATDTNAAEAEAKEAEIGDHKSKKSIGGKAPKGKKSGKNNNNTNTNTSASNNTDIELMIEELESQRSAIKGGDITPKSDARHVVYPLSPLSAAAAAKQDTEVEVVQHAGKRLVRQESVDKEDETQI